MTCDNIYCFWTGENQMAEARMKGLMSLEMRSGCDVVLITPQNLNDFIVEPLHPAYEYLALVHKSDYLRCYFMYHFGGGYSDIKPCVSSWKYSFDALYGSDDWVLGYQELNAGVVALCKDKPDMKIMLQNNWRLLIGCDAFICKPKTDFTTDWHNEVNEFLSLKYYELQKNPGNTWGDNKGYPIGWTQLLGDIFQPLVLKYNSKIIQDNKIKPDFTKEYR